MRCLNLKLTYNCTNSCSFCFSSYLKEASIGKKGLLQAVEDGYQRDCRELVLSGGEPTLRADVLCDVMDYAAELGYTKYIIQTNGSGFVDFPALVPRLGEFSRKFDVCVSFSIHGHTSEIHDEMSQTPGAFIKLMAGMRLIRERTQCGIYTNTVMSRLNLPWLKEIVSLLSPFHPEIIQFAMMHLKKSGPLSTGLLEAASAVRELGGLVDHSILKTEGIPYCLLYGMEECVGESYWPSILDLYNKDHDYMANFDQLDSGMRWKRDDCRRCIMDEVCMGLWREHAEEFVHSDVHPIYGGEANDL